VAVTVHFKKSGRTRSVDTLENVNRVKFQVYPNPWVLMR